MLPTAIFLAPLTALPAAVKGTLPVQGPPEAWPIWYESGLAAKQPSHPGLMNLNLFHLELSLSLFPSLFFSFCPIPGCQQGQEWF